jgi:uncharacterized membrane protein YecN with MAPEG domain
MLANFDAFILYTALNSLLLVVLAFNVSRLRWKFKVSYGDGDNRVLHRAIRTHANGVEFVVIFGLILLALTYQNASDATLMAYAMIFTVARVVQSVGMLKRVVKMRQLGAGVTYLGLLVGSVQLLLNL